MTGIHYQGNKRQYIHQETNETQVKTIWRRGSKGLQWNLRRKKTHYKSETGSKVNSNQKEDKETNQRSGELKRT